MSPKDEKSHVVDCLEVDEVDDIDGDDQLALVWCETCAKHEWWWLPKSDIGQDVRHVFTIREID